MADDAAPPLACGARWDGGDLVLTVRVITRSAQEAVLAEPESLKVRLTTPPVEGRANRRLCALLADLCGVPKTRVSVEAGSSSRLKRVRVVAPRMVPPLLVR